MKRKALIRHLEEHGCEFLREGKKHTVYVNRGAQASLPFRDIVRSKIFSRARSAAIFRFPIPRQHNKGLQPTPNQHASHRELVCLM